MATTTTDKIIGRRLAIVMKQRNITQSDLGRRIGMDQGLLSAKMNGRRTWRADEVFRIANAIEVDLDELMPSHEQTNNAIDALERLPLDDVRAIVHAEQSTGLSVSELVQLACDSSLDSPLKTLAEHERTPAGEDGGSVARPEGFEPPTF